jgi:hypothetical protein
MRAAPNGDEFALVPEWHATDGEHHLLTSNGTRGPARQAGPELLNECGIPCAVEGREGG